MRDNYNIGETLSQSEWIEVLLDKEITREKDIRILQILYSFEGHKAAASQIGMIMTGEKGRKAASPLNLEVGNWGKRLLRKYPVKLTKRENNTERKWDVFFDGWQESTFFIWKIKKELVRALEKTRLTGDEQYPEEIPLEEQDFLIEGFKRTITVNTYERNSNARKKCIEYWKAICFVCDFEFENKYGDIGNGFIHIHHLVPLSNVGKAYQVDPINDLRPICPNCHAMLHKTNPPLSIDELKGIIINR